MLGFNHLGRMGQLGNQMFQYASLKGIARNRGFDYMVANNEDPVVDALGNRLYTELFNPFNLDVKQGVLETDRYIQEPHFHFSEELFDNCPDNTSLVGYYQTPMYFNHIRDEIRKDFTFRKEILEPCKDMMGKTEDAIALHIRRGDFITNVENHYNQGLEYYEQALKRFDKRREVIIFSDDTEWCNKQKLFQPDRFLIAEGNSSYVDMCLMSLCTGFIIANSTFSWWPAWLSEAEDKDVVYPKNWFGITGYTKDHDVSDLFPRRWLKI